jgi:U3 small nucleolar RNA-associated protein 12
MLKTHQKQIVSSRELKGVLEGVRGELRGLLSGKKDEVGFNVAALKVLGERVDGERIVRLEDVEAGVEGERRKRGFVDVA